MHDRVTIHRGVIEMSGKFQNAHKDKHCSIVNKQNTYPGIPFV